MSSSSIFVAVRVRPFIKEDTALIAASGSKAAPIVSMSTRNNTVHVEGDQAGFRCDAALWGLPDLADRDGNPAVGQAAVYDRTARPILDTALEGYNGCVLAYGQTGSGKTFTMMGAGAFENPNALPETAGVIPRLCADLFARTQAIATETAGELTWTVEASYVEVYLEKVTDLLAAPVSRRPGDGPVSIAVREDLGGAFVLVGATRTRVASLADVMRLLERGAAQRRTAATNMNEHSSRSHALLYLYLTETLTVPPAQPGAAPMSATSRRVQLKLVDLAGSERANETGATGDRLREAQAINRSLFTLGNVIDVLSGGGGGGPAAGNGSAGARASVTRMTPPYRDSVLTKLLKDCLGGNSKTVMIAAIGPGEPFRSQTVSTLNYATRARRVMNLAVACEDPQAAELRRNQEELRRVKAELDEARRTAADAVAAASAAAMQSAGATAEEVSAAAAAAAAEAAAAEAARIALLEAQLAEQQGRMEADQAQAHRRDAQLEQQRKDLDALAAETADAEARCVAQAAALKDAERKFQQERADADAALVDAQRRTAEAQRALAAQTAAADVERAGLERQRTDALMRLEQLEADRQARQRELDDLAGREAALRAQMEQHKRELQLKESALLRLQEESSALQRRRADGVNAARSLTDELLERIRALEAENLLLRRGVRPCPRCTVEVSITDKTCGVCGSPLPSLAPPVATNVSGSPNSRSYSVSQ